MTKKKNKKRTQKFSSPAPAKATKSPAVEPVRSLTQNDEFDAADDYVDDDFDSDSDDRWIAVTPPDPWYSPHFWAISVEDPSAERMRETIIAANVLRILAPVALLAAFAPLSRVSRVGCVLIAVVFFGVGTVAAIFGRRALDARKKREFDDAARSAKIAKYGLVGLHAALIVVALLGVMTAAWFAFLAFGDSMTNQPE